MRCPGDILDHRKPFESFVAGEPLKFTDTHLLLKIHLDGLWRILGAIGL